MKILIIEDNILLRENIIYLLTGEKFNIDSAENGEIGYQKALKNNYELIILDLMLPIMDGVTIVKYLKSNNIKTPILVLSAKGNIEDKVSLLNLGCDDYLTKPFVSTELLARINSIIRRTHDMLSPVIRVVDLEINTCSKEVMRQDKRIDLTVKEYMLLEYLAFNKNRVVDRAELAENIWGKEIGLLTLVNSIDFHIKNLRKKIDHGFNKKILKTKRGFGFVLTDGII
jgi:two-component system, OmpR family, response regulator